MPIFQTKIYRTRNKSNSIFFSPEFKKKLIIFMSSEESNNPDFVDNLTKTTKALGLDAEHDVLFHSIDQNKVLDWSGILEHKEPIVLAFFGSNLTGFRQTQVNSVNKIGIHTLFETFSMREIVEDSTKKAQFWLSFKALFGK